MTVHDGLGNQTTSTYPIAVAAGAPASPPPPAPVLTLLSARVAGQSVLTRLSCSGAACVGEARLTTREKLRSGKPIAIQSRHTKTHTTYRTVVVGVAHFKLSAGQTLNVSVAINAAGRKLLRSFGKLPTTLTVAAKTTVAVKHLTILPPPKPRAKHKKH